MVANSKALLITAPSSAPSDVSQQLFYATADAQGAIAVQLVGTFSKTIQELTGFGLDAYTTANFLV